MQGNSAGDNDGGFTAADCSLPAEHNRIVISALDGKLTVKRLLRQCGRVFLVPENPDYPKFDITDREHVHVWGVVTYAIHKV